ncbi:hydrogenobyrinic acid a,c-diamide synthase (glutamine-hydrolysing) /cobyrinate a,c-diamide synthase [Frankia sp. CcI6]|nr:hydrogenobyrinic acid a,c-diamide synthase (glutamine-hydrolysing) /cobyrinate a,c-diamide synthase [Frankia sp. CcI6]KFB03929.1 hydrogenobyrinic acid a,c-diamide synthase (glutamine-hydrolysing)/cobyrinate a,c-diamide synthase [Frankia sp. Allo2]
MSEPRAEIDIPRLVLAAPASGAGKTTVTTGLMAAFTARGLHVSPHKVGPDYIDPSYHALACGRPGRNLDAVLCGAARIAALFAHGARGADLAVVEGVMGLFDGVARPGPGEQADHASTAHVARLLDAPVVLVVDVSGAARSIAALVAGFRGFDRRIRLAGVILNRVGSPHHRDLLTEALDDIAVPVLGALPREQAVHTPSRHLGLVPAAERRPAAVAAVDRLGALVGSACDLDALLRVARTAPPLRVARWEPATVLAAAGPAAVTTADPAMPAMPAMPDRPPRVAVAGGAAFTFGYPEHIELLTAAGADVVPVDPLRDETLPPGTDALIIGGGFPEEHVAALADNARLRAEVAAFAARGGPVAAECAGLLYLARTLDGAPMCGVLDVEAVMGPRLTLGYRSAIAAADSPLAAAGTTVHAHEFHRTVLRPPPGRAPCDPRSPSPAHGAAGPPPGSSWVAAWWLPVPETAPRPAPGRVAGGGRRGGQQAASPWMSEGFVYRRVHASYLHLHWAGRPGAATRLLAAARAARREDGRDTAGAAPRVRAPKPAGPPGRIQPGAA